MEREENSLGGLIDKNNKIFESIKSMNRRGEVRSKMAPQQLRWEETGIWIVL